MHWWTWPPCKFQNLFFLGQFFQHLFFFFFSNFSISHPPKNSTSHKQCYIEAQIKYRPPYQTFFAHLPHLCWLRSFGPQFWTLWAWQEFNICSVGWISFFICWFLFVCTAFFWTCVCWGFWFWAFLVLSLGSFLFNNFFK